MKKLRNAEHNLVGFTTSLASYGKLRGNYMLQLVSPIFKTHLTIYKGKSKPLFRNLYITAIPSVVYSLVFSFAAPFIISYMLLTAFYEQCLFRESFINESYHKLSGYVSLVLSVIGLISIILWCI